MNYEGQWENHLRDYMKASGERVDDFEDNEDDEEYFI